MKLNTPLNKEFLAQLHKRLSDQDACDILNYLIAKNFIPIKIIRRYVVISLIEEKIANGQKITPAIQEIAAQFNLSERTCWNIRDAYKNAFK